MIGSAPPPPEDRRSPLTPQLVLRVAIVGSVALGMFAIIFFRLWFLQVLSGNQYLAQAQTNRVRDIAIAAPRGDILDRNGTILVNSIRALAVQISPPDLPVAVTTGDILHPPRADAVLYNHLAHVLGMSTKPISCQLPVTLKILRGTQIASVSRTRVSEVACDVAQQVDLVPYGDVTVRSGTDVSKYMQYYLAERQQEFRGVSVQLAYVTGYPQQTLAAQVLGTVGRITSTELGEKAYKGKVPPDTVIGQSGLEAQYDSFLGGTAGKEQVQVNSLGLPTGVESTTAPAPGLNLRTSLDVGVQRVGQAALQESINANPPADGGAFVALNPDNGEVYGMGSLPSFNPDVFTGTFLPQSTYESLTGPNSGDPLLNRAIQSAGPTGSTFKPITAVAALESGDWLIDQTFDDTGQFCIGTGAAQQCRHNSGNAAYGVVDLVDAIKVSDDNFFYNLGARTNVNPAAAPNGGPLDHWAHALGIGRSTGIDLPNAVDGTLPDPKWRTSRNELEAECDDATGPFRYTNGQVTGPRKLKGWYRAPKHSAGGCGIADGTNRPWSIGDNISLAVGQGDVQVTPLQLAIAYAALANGGTIVRPHIGLDVESQDGTILQKIDPPASRHVDINPLYLETIREGLREAASSTGGTSAPVFSNFAQQVYGKTGTAQYISPTTGVEEDYSWYACFVPASATSKPIVVVVTVEKGGFGAVAAAPVAREILSQWFYGKPGPFQAGSSTTL